MANVRDIENVVFTKAYLDLIKISNHRALVLTQIAKAIDELGIPYNVNPEDFAGEIQKLKAQRDDLLAACEALLARGTEWDGEANGQHWERIAVKREVIQKARAAIARARGSPPQGDGEPGTRREGGIIYAPIPD